MNWKVLGAGFMMWLCVAGCSAASLKDIRTQQLPADPSIRAAIADATDLEPWVSVFMAKWTAPVSKDQATARLALDMRTMEAARAKFPENEEVALLSGLIASYAYNLDVKNSWDEAPAALQAAMKLSPEDIRSAWFLANHHCQTTEFVSQGMRGFLSIESSKPGPLPSSFWIDYVTCAAVVSMPAHLLRAVSHLGESERALPEMAALLKNYGKIASVTTDYKPEQLWFGSPAENGTNYRSYACGVSFTAAKDWKPQFYPVANGVCAVVLQLPPMKGVQGNWTPNIVITAHVARTNEPFANYVAKVNGTRGVKQEDPRLVSQCPFPDCQAVEMFDKESYPSEAGGLGLILQAERADPMFPGISIETQPNPPPTSSAAVYYTPPVYIQRFPGEIYYAVLLDTAVSISPEAERMFYEFLKTVRVD